MSLLWRFWHLPNTLVIVTLVSYFGTFLLYMLTCWVAMVAFREHHTFSTTMRQPLALLSFLPCNPRE